MKPIKVKYTKKTFKGSLPKSWGEVPFYKYVQYLKLLDEQKEPKPSDIFAIFTGVPAYVWEFPRDPKLHENIQYALKFINTEPTGVRPNTIERKGKFYDIPNNFLNLDLGRYLDLKNIIASVMNGKEDALPHEQIEVMADLTAIFATDDYSSVDDIKEIAEDVKHMPTDTVYILGSFFLSKLTVLSSGTVKNAEGEGYLWSKSKQVMRRLVAVLVLFIAYIIRPMAIILSIRNFIKSLLLMFTGGNNYRVVCIPQRKHTVK
jgi:hypothetical protein